MKIVSGHALTYLLPDRYLDTLRAHAARMRSSSSSLSEPGSGSSTRKSFKYYDLILGAYVCVLLCANLIGPAKVSTVYVPLVGNVTFIAGVLFFPFSYFFGDILTEVYGYARDRRVVWSGFAALMFASIMATVVVHLPPADFWRDKEPAVEDDLRQHTADHRGLHHCLLERLVRQQLRAGQD